MVDNREHLQHRNDILFIKESLIKISTIQDTQTQDVKEIKETLNGNVGLKVRLGIVETKINSQWKMIGIIVGIITAVSGVYAIIK